MDTARRRRSVVVLVSSVWSVLVIAQGASTGGDLARYKAMLARLDTKTPACLETARKELETFQGGHADSQAALRAFRQFYLARMGEQEQVLSGPGTWRIVYGYWQLPPDLHPLVPHPLSVIRLVKSAAASENPTLTAQLDAILKWPFAVVQSEGDWYLQPHAEWLVKAAHWLPGPLAEYLAFRLRESTEVVEEDAGLMMTWDELRQRIGRWDDFARAHSSLPESQDEVIPAVKSMFWVYTCGSDNSRAYGRGEPWLLVPELRESYSQYVNDRVDRFGRAYIEGLLATLKQSGYRRTSAVDQYLARPDYPGAHPCRPERR
jgi:hypothetical protein